MSITPRVLAGPGAVPRLLLDQVAAGSAHRFLQKPNIRRHSGRDRQRAAMSKRRKDGGKEAPWTPAVVESLAMP